MSTTYQDLVYTTFPDSIQTFVNMLNMTTADGAAVAGYQQAMQNGDYVAAQQYYNQIANGDRKFIDSTKMNTLLDTCAALQRFYTSDIEPYITSKQQDWQNIVNQFSYKGIYSPVQVYYKNNFVTSEVSGVNQVFICIENAPAGTNITDPTYWRQLTIRGRQGPSGDTMTFRYNWDSSQTYYVNDVVTYGNGIYGCTQQNANQTPSSASSYWRLIYTSSQVIYPFSSTEPTGTTLGALWFQILT